MYCLHYGSDISLRQLYRRVLHCSLSECSDSINIVMLTDHFSCSNDQGTCACLFYEKEKKTHAADFGRNFAWAKTTGCNPNEISFTAYLFNFLKFLRFDRIWDLNLCLKLLLQETKLLQWCRAVTWLLRLCFAAYLNAWKLVVFIRSPDE